MYGESSNGHGITLASQPDKDSIKEENYRPVFFMNIEINSKNIWKFNSTIHKKNNTSQPSGVHLKNPRLAQHSNTKVIHHVKRLKKKNHIISIKAEKAFNKTQHPLITKTTQDKEQTMLDISTRL